jgi:predicted amino acid racemase
MFLDTIQNKNPELLELASYYHQKGIIPPNCYLIDVDSVRENAAMIAREARLQGLKLYFMSKQFGRNPIVFRAVRDAGIASAVAVDPWEAKKLTENGIHVGHVGHLVQVPRLMISDILKLNPEVYTVLSYDNAKLVSDAALNLEKRQKILLRVIDKNDSLYAGQIGGIWLEQLHKEAEKIGKLPGVVIGGVTSFPCLTVEGGEAKPTANFTTLIKAAEYLKNMGCDDLQINTPSVSSTSTMKLIKDLGGTHAEPGHALTGSTPLHASDGQPEKPAMVYVTEVSHLLDDNAYVYGGGFYHRSNVKHALVGKQWAQMKQIKVAANDTASIDYYGTLHSKQVSVGDTALFAFRTQVFVTRSSVAVVEGVGKSPKILGMYDSQGNSL